jgi:autotransporter-associated beta strand protein
MRRRKTVLVCAAAAAAAAAVLGSQLSAAEIQWKGGTGDLLATNYTIDGVDTRGVASGDFLNIGANGTVTTAGTTVPGRVRVGHNFTTFTNLDGTTGSASTLTGPATLTVTGGTLSLGGNGSAGTYAGVRAGLVVGYNADGTFNHTAGITQVTQNVVIGADNPDDAFTGTGTGTLNVSGGTFRVLRNDMLIGYGNPGVVTLTAGGNIDVFPTNMTQTEAPDLYVGFTTASSFTKTNLGLLRVANNMLIGSGSTVSLSAGTITTKWKSVANGWASTNVAPAGNMVVGRTGSTGDTLNISGSATVNIGNRFLLGSGGAGGNNSVVNQTGGTVTVALNLAVSDTGGSSTYNLSGGTLTFNSDLSRVGRRGDGKFFQNAGPGGTGDGGIVNFNAGLAIGEDNSTAAGETDDATGLYEISLGQLHTTLAGNALQVGTAGNGTFRVVGSGGLVDVNGNMLVGNTSDGVGNLAYRFESGEGLSLIDVSGNATFAAGTGLNFDTSLAAPGQRFYDLLTAADVVDNGLVPGAGWAHTIVAGGNGEILRAGQLATLYWDTNGVIPGSGGASPSGSWDAVAANFTPDAAGASADTASATTFADDVVFGAGTDGTGSYTVTVSGTQTAHSVQIARGDVTLTGGTIAAPIFDVASGATATVSSNLAGGPAASLTKTGAGTLTLTSANTYAGGTTVNAGTLALGAGGSLADAGAVNVNGGTFDVNSVGDTVGAVTLTSGSITGTTGVLTGASYAVQSGSISAILGGSGALTKTTPGTVTLSGANTYTGGTMVNVGTLVVANGDAFGGGSVNVADGALAQAQAGLSKAVTVTTLATNATGKFDLTDNSMVIKGLDTTQVRGLINGAFNAGHWNGATGLDSSTAAANASGTTAIGYGTAGFLNKSSFKGVTPLNTTDVLVKYTYYGDSDLSGATNLDDFTLFLGGYQNAGATWSQGDYDYSGLVTLDDFTLFLKGYQQQGAPLSELEALINSVPMSASERAGMLAAVQAVPEPASVGLLAAGGLLGLTRRRRATLHA